MNVRQQNNFDQDNCRNSFKASQFKINNKQSIKARKLNLFLFIFVIRTELSLVLQQYLNMESDKIQIKQQETEAQKLNKIAFLVHSHFPEYPLQQIEIFSLNGLSNQTYKVSCKENQSLVFKKFSQLGGNRQLQNKIVSILQTNQISPKLFFANKEYRIELFIQNCKHPTLDQLKTQDFQNKFMKLLDKYHKIQINELKFNQPLFQYALSAQYHNKVLSYQNVRKDIQFQDLQTQFRTTIQSLSSIIKKLTIQNKQSLAFCHNDLNNLNIFIEPKMSFIDYQYSSYNYIAYDIGNFLNQSTIRYDTSQFPFFKLQRSIKKQEIDSICALYPSRYENMQSDVIVGLAVCNLYWAGWSLIMANDKSQNGFGTVQHGLMRINQFRHYLSLIDDGTKGPSERPCIIERAKYASLAQSIDPNNQTYPND